MTSLDWIEIAQNANQKILELPSLTTHDYEYQIYSKAKANALIHAAASYAVLPEEYNQAFAIELSHQIE